MKTENMPFFYILILLNALSHVAADIYLPSFQAIREELNVTDGQIQMSMAYFMFSFAISQLVYGPFSDAFGRRYPLIIGLIICLIGSIICYVAPSIEILNLGRFLQGFGAGAGTVLGRAMMRDRFSGIVLARYLSYMGSAAVIVMVIAPLAGGYIQELFDWRMNFAVLIVYVGAVLVSILGVSETNSYADRHAIKIHQLFVSSRTVLSNHDFLGYTACLALAYGGVLIWLSVGPILLEESLHLTPSAVGWLIFMEGSFCAIGSWINAILVGKQGYVRTTQQGLIIVIISGFILLFFWGVNIFNVFTLMFAIAVYSIGASFVFSNAFSGALHAFQKTAGLASSLCGFLQILGAALATMIYSFLDNTDPFYMGIGFFFIGILSYGIFKIMIKEYGDQTLTSAD